MNRSVSASDKKVGLTLGELRNLVDACMGEEDSAEVWGRLKIGGRALEIEVRGGSS